MLRRTIALPVLASLAACGSAPTPGTPEFIQAHHESEVAQMKATAAEAPDWFVNPPKDAGFVYAAGSATSSDLQFSLDKAILNAKYQLADQVNGKLSGKQRDWISDNGAKAVSTADRTTSNVIADVALPGYQVVNRKVVPVDTQFRSYVLLKFGAAQTAAAEPAPNLQKQAKAAYDDLEAELAAVRQQQAPAPAPEPAPMASDEPPPPAAAPKPSVAQEKL
jgi:hypothetical protein